MSSPDQGVSSDLGNAMARVSRLDAQMRSLASIFGERCLQIPVSVLSPLGMAELLEPEAVKVVLSVVEKVRNNERVNRLEVVTLLEACAPRYYHPGPKVLFSCAPDLANALIVQYPDMRTVIGNTLAPSDEEIATVIGHEKYGHGYLYLETTLGRQLVYILSDHELYQAIVTRSDPKFLNAPWKRDFFDEHEAWLPYLLGSVVVVEEGFSAWVQTKLLLCMGNHFASHAVYKLTRHPLAVPFNGLVPFLPYFQARGYPNLPGRLFSPHKQGYDWIDDIYALMGYSCMSCVLRTVQLAMDIDFGISKDLSGAIRVAMRPNSLIKYLQDGKPPYYLADQRLVALRNVMLDSFTELDALRQGWSCQATLPCSLPEEQPCSTFLESLIGKLPQWLYEDA